MQWPLTWRGGVLSGIVSVTVWAYARNASGEIPPGYPPLDREDAAHRGEAQGIGFGGQHPCVLTYGSLRARRVTEAFRFAHKDSVEGAAHQRDSHQ